LSREEKQIVIAPQKGKQELAFNLKVDVLIYGGAAGSGKSRLLLMKPLQYINDPDYEAVFFRRTTKALEKAGSLWPESKKLWRPFAPRVRERDHQHIFPGGATISMDHLEHEKDAEGNHQGTQYSGIHFDELTHFSQTQFLYLIGRMRSSSEGDSYCMATCNPDPDSWVYDWIEWYLDDSEEGYPDETKCGKIRYFVIVDESPIFADTEEELAEAYPDICYQEDPATGELIYVAPLSFSFINGTIFDNPALIRANPKYLSALKSQTKINRARLLDGAWRVRAEGSSLFDRKWLHKVDAIPRGCKECRAWDKASQEPSDVNRYPDYTAGSPKIAKDNDGNYYLYWGFVDEATDKNSGIIGKFRKRPGERDNLILKQSQQDGSDCTVVFAIDPGQSGKVEFRESSKKLIEKGFTVRSDPMPNTKSKTKRFEPFSSACQNGLVSIVESSFPNKATLDAFYKEMESFCEERSTAHRKDDWPDATASGFNWLAQERVIKIVPRNQTHSKTYASEVLEQSKHIKEYNQENQLRGYND
jgi:predicted phage terminase large subunit-like protein